MIDYNQDIAPLRQQYFPMLAGEQAFDQAMKYRQEVLMPMQMQTMKMEEQQMRMRQQDLSYKQQQFNLRQARKAARRENEAMDRLPEVIDQLNSIIDRPDQNVFDQQRDIAKLQMQYQTVAQYAPLFNNLFNSASNSVSNQYKQQEEVSGLLYQAAVSGVPVDTIRQQAEADGITTPREQISIDIAEAVSKKGVTKALKEQQEFEMKRDEDLQEARVARGKDLIGSLKELIPDEKSGSFEGAAFLSATDDDTTLDFLQKADDSQKAYNRAVLESIYVETLPLDKQIELETSGRSLSELSDIDLFKGAYNRAMRMQRSSDAQQNRKPSLITSKFIPKTAE